MASQGAASHLRKSHDWLGWNARRLGIPRYRVRGRWYYDPTELEQWARDQRDQHATNDPQEGGKSPSEFVLMKEIKPNYKEEQTDGKRRHA